MQETLQQEVNRKSAATDDNENCNIQRHVRCDRFTYTIYYKQKKVFKPVPRMTSSWWSTISSFSERRTACNFSEARRACLHTCTYMETNYKRLCNGALTSGFFHSSCALAPGISHLQGITHNYVETLGENKMWSMYVKECQQFGW